jgi:sugar O-acyltransferase (sialic acid O-acetyltransferase NeuD family)
MRLAILGASGHGKVVADIALLLGYTDVVFFDDEWPSRSSFGRWSLIGTTETLLDTIVDFDAVIVGIGDNRIRFEKDAVLKAANAPLVTLVHPTAVISNFAQIGIGSVVCAGAIVSVDATLGAGIIVNTDATVDHDCQLADGVHIAPGVHLSGGVHVGARSWIGVGACVKQGVNIGSDVVVGAGAVVVSNILDGLTLVGNPARPIIEKE